MRAVFDGARQKAARADDHVNAIHAEIRKFVENPNCIRIDERDCGDPEIRLLHVNIARPLPGRLGPIIGDAVHNLRAALDHAAYQVATIAGHSGNDVYFPVSDTVEGLARSPHYKLFERLAPKVADAIHNRIRPYRAGDRLIWCLHRLDIHDKHRILIPVVQEVYVLLEHPDGSTDEFTLEPDGGGFSQRLPRQVAFGLRHRETRLGIYYEQDTVLAGEEVIDSLVQQQESVRAAIECLEACI